MFSALNLQASTPAIHRFKVAGNLTFSQPPPSSLRFPPRRFTVLSVQSSENVASSEPLISSEFTSSVGSPSLQLSHSTLSHRHITVLNILACAVAISTTWLFCSAIPTLLAFKRAAESLEKLLDVTREELPDTMAAVRLSGMEISDLTMELSDLGQEITQGVKRSTRAVRVAEEKMRQFANMTSTAPMQIVSTKATSIVEPALAKSARGMREGIVKGRSMIQMLFALTGFSRSVANFFFK
ncbi:uncharacterized protein LOC110703191 isoform X1 [Chenopodium quinoa]|uniref:Transmembrane protein n=1 Tax=Chenopodium quinoa TaxID=63459 RepID=A0A803LMU3_CHEQI|nr:uncharacterized protein LOC110703191 isoform X1 [Chenopodium quinoa]